MVREEDLEEAITSWRTTASTADSDTTLDAFLGGRLGSSSRPRLPRGPGRDPPRRRRARAPRPPRPRARHRRRRGDPRPGHPRPRPRARRPRAPARLRRARPPERGPERPARWRSSRATCRPRPNPCATAPSTTSSSNPPYYDRAASTRAQDPGRDLAHGGAAPLAAWLALAARRLGPRGTLSVIQRAARLPDLLAALPATLGSVEVLPLAPREGAAPRRSSCAPARAAVALPPPRAPARPLHDGPGLRPWASAVLRDGAALCPGVRQPLRRKLALRPSRGALAHDRIMKAVVSSP
jgi:hypothetical protein